MKLLIVFILGLFFFSNGFSQTDVKGIYKTKTDLCSASFLFLPGGLFYFEGGCEDRSSILKGAYKITKDSVQLIADPSPLRYSIKSTGAIVDNERTLTVKDVEGQPLAYFKVFALPASIITDTLKNMKVLITDSNGVLKLNTNQIADISFDRFSTLRVDESNRYTWVQLSKMKGSNHIVQFNYPRFCLKYPQINVGASVSNLKRLVGDDAVMDDKQNIYTKSKN